jgi:hypothetical protein
MFCCRAVHPSPTREGGLFWRNLFDWVVLTLSAMLLDLRLERLGAADTAPFGSPCLKSLQADLHGCRFG